MGDTISLPYIPCRILPYTLYLRPRESDFARKGILKNTSSMDELSSAASQRNILRPPLIYRGEATFSTVTSNAQSSPSKVSAMGFILPRSSYRVGKKRSRSPAVFTPSRAKAAARASPTPRRAETGVAAVIGDAGITLPPRCAAKYPCFPHRYPQALHVRARNA